MKSIVKKSINLQSVIKKLNRRYGYILIHPDGAGYVYKVLWGEDYKLEIVGGSSKVHKTKKDCVRAVKKLSDFWGCSVLGSNVCYDHAGNQIDIKIKYDVKRLL